MKTKYYLALLAVTASSFLVACGGGSSAPTPTSAPGNITVTVTGLTANSPTITLGEEDSATSQTFTTGGTGSDTFVLNTSLASGAAYSVATAVSPMGMTCSESANNTGTLPETSNVQVACSTPLLGVGGGGAAATAPLTLTTVFQNGISPQGFKFYRQLVVGSSTSSGTATLGTRLPPNGIWPLSSYPSNASYTITMTPPSGSGYSCVLASTSQPTSGTFNSTPDPVNVIYNCGNPGTP